MSKDGKKVYYRTDSHDVIVDEESGEVKEEYKHHTSMTKLPEEPPFVKLYLDCLSKFKDIQLSFNPILLEFLKRATYADEDTEIGGEVLYLNKRLKQTIAKKCNVSLKRVEQAITEFVKKGYMYRIDVGTYQFNANLFGKGNWGDVYNIRNIQANFNFGTGEVVADIVHDEEKKINKATEEIADQSEKKLTELAKKKDTT